LLRLAEVGDNAAMEAEPPKADPPKRKRRWFQFSLRTLMIFTVIVAVPCAWMGRKIDQKRHERNAVETIRKLGGAVYYNYEMETDFEPPEDRHFNAQPHGPGWLRRILGDDFFSDPTVAMVAGDDWSDDDLACFEALPTLKSVRLGPALRVTDDGLAHLENLSQLESLSLSSRGITDAALVHVKPMTKLQILLLPMSPSVKDDGLVNLRGLKQLKNLNVHGTAITIEAVAELQKALPNCDIRY
jgi:hypothetical protein